MNALLFKTALIIVVLSAHAFAKCPPGTPPGDPSCGDEEVQDNGSEVQQVLPRTPEGRKPGAIDPGGNPIRDRDPNGNTDPNPTKPEEKPRSEWDKPSGDKLTKDTPSNEKPQTPSGENPQTPGNENGLTIYNPRNQPSPEQIRRENEVRDAENMQLMEQRAVGHSRSGFDNSAPDTVYVPTGPVIDPYMAQRLLAVRAMAEDPRVPAGLGNQVITLLLNVDPSFSNVGPIVAQAEKILSDGGAKKLFADVVDAEKVTKPSAVTLLRDEKVVQTTEKKAYLQDQILGKTPAEIITADAQRNIKTGDVNVYISKGDKKAAAGNAGGGGGYNKPLILRRTDDLAEGLLAGLALRTDDGGSNPPPANNPGGAGRSLASVETSDTRNLPNARLAPVEAPSNARRLGLMLILAAAAGAGFLYLGKRKKKVENEHSAAEEPTREAKEHAPEAATSATKVVKR